jgi:tetratricopeptide (TPR) repeat protein
MSLLLEALKSTDLSPAQSADSQEEPLGGREILKVLEKAPVSAALTLESNADAAAAAFPDWSPETSATRDPAAAPPPDPARRTTKPSIALIPAQASPLRRYGVMLAVAVAAVLAVLFGKSMLQPHAAAVVYPDSVEATAGSVAQPATSSNTAPVQVPIRPASQFSFSGSAPEIDLHENTLAPAATRAASVAAPRLMRAEAAPVAAAAAAPVPDSSAPQGTLSVARSTGQSSVDRHIAEGYRALTSGNIEIAKREYLVALDLDPNNVDALMGTASAAARLGNATIATAAYSKVLSLEPGNTDATAALAMLSHDRAADETNESRLKIMIASDSQRAPALHTALAGVYAADARWADAAQEYFIALNGDPGNSDLAFNLAASLDQNRNAAAAITYYNQALAFAKLRPAQIDVNAVEKRVGQLQARLEAHPASPTAAP